MADSGDEDNIPNVIQPHAVTVEEIIAATLAAASRPTKPKVSNSEIAALLPEFGGKHDEDIDAWFQRITTVQGIYQVPDEVMILIVAGKLRDQAQAWFHSRADYAALSLQELRTMMTPMFRCRESKLNLMKRFEARRWRKNEKFAQYYHDKLLAGNKLYLEEADMIMYMIEGLDNPILQSQCKMKEFKSLTHLLDVMNDVTQEERHQRVVPSMADQNRRNTSGGLPTNNKIIQNRTTQPVLNKDVRRCFNCNKLGHYASVCQAAKREPGSCYECGSRDHQRRDCPKTTSRKEPDSTTPMYLIQEKILPAYTIQMNVIFNDKYSLNKINALIDSGSGITLIKESLVPKELISSYDSKIEFRGINESKLNILGIIDSIIVINERNLNLRFHVVDDSSMRFDIVVGRNLLGCENVELVIKNKQVMINIVENKNEHVEFYNNDILLIDVHDDTDMQQPLVTDNTVNANDIKQLHHIFHTHYESPEKPEHPEIRRLSYAENQAVNNIVSDMQDKRIIRKSKSPYSSPVVLVKKRNGELRMCHDYRSLNKITQKDRFPVPIIEDQIAELKGKRVFTHLDFKSAFHHIDMEESSIKYTSFVTPGGQYEYIKMPFGLCNSGAAFMRFITEVFQELLEKGLILIYVDDVLIATATVEENLEILVMVLDLCVRNKLVLRVDKCKFLMSEISYLGYTVNAEGVRPEATNIKTLIEFPVPTNHKQLQSFIGLASYFRKFVKNFSIIAKPLYDRMRNKEWAFEEPEMECFVKLKSLLVEEPILSIYSPTADTELHCDASQLGYGAILFQRQEDRKMHPVFYFSKRTSETESRYHSYELECLAIINAIKRFYVYLHGIQFKIVTDCDSLRLTLSKKDIVPRIMRWALYLENFNYSIEHRPSERMKHVDALSRCHNILIITENPFDTVLAIKQDQDTEICHIKKELDNKESKIYEIRNGLLYKKFKDRILFVVPKAMQKQILFKYHDEMGHMGQNKVMELITKVDVIARRD